MSPNCPHTPSARVPEEPRRAPAVGCAGGTPSAPAPQPSREGAGARRREGPRGSTGPSPAQGQGLGTTSSFPWCSSAGGAGRALRPARLVGPGGGVGTWLCATRAPALAAISVSSVRGLSSSAELGRRRGCGAEVLQGTSLCLLKGTFVKRSLQLACDPFPFFLPPSLPPALPPCPEQP